MYQVDYSGQISYISSYFCCHVRVEGLLHDTECDLLAIAKFRVPLSLRYFTKYNHCFFFPEIGNIRDQVTNLERELYRANQVRYHAKSAPNAHIILF